MFVLYLDLMSQPCRAVLWLARLLELPHEVKIVRIAKNEHKQMMDVNPTGRLPFVTYNNEVMYESHAIMRFMCRVAGPEGAKWLPFTDALRTQRVDQWLDWHHTNLRIGSAMTFRARFLHPLIGLPPVSDKGIKRFANILKSPLQFMDDALAESRWLVASLETPTIADISLASELLESEHVNGVLDKVRRRALQHKQQQASSSL